MMINIDKLAISIYIIIIQFERLNDVVKNGE
jgi:hypothetical protein